MASRIIVPLTPFEWSRVKSKFKTNKLEDVKECLSILEMGMTRMGEQTPVAILCSEVVLQAVLAEYQYRECEESEQSYMLREIRAKHGIAVLRTVSFINEIGQTKNVLLNMTDAVKPFGIPAWVVELRHKIAHNHMPDIEELRRAIEFWHDWLYTTFWQKDPTYAMNFGDRSAENDEMSQLKQEQEETKQKMFVKHLKQFRKWREKNSQARGVTKEGLGELYQLYENLATDAECFMRLLVQDGWLILDKEQLRRMDIITSDSNDYKIDTQVEQFWEPVLFLIFECKLSCELMCALLDRLREKKLKKESMHQITAYCRTMIETFTRREIFSVRDLSTILDAMLTVPSYFQPELFELILANIPDMKRKRRDQIRKMLNISHSLWRKCDNGGDEAIRTVDDLQKLKKRGEQVHKENRKKIAASLNEISICDADEWRNIPLGLCPGQDAEMFSLVITDDILEKLK